jgi:hypothetical protein
MLKVWTNNVASFVKALVLVVLLSGFAEARQDTQKKEPEPNAPASTADAWKQALPESEKSSTSEDKPAADSSAEESPEEIEKRLGGLERKWQEAVKLHDTVALKRILAADFTHTNAQSAVSFADRDGYIEQSARGSALSPCTFDKLAVRVYGTTAVVNASCQQQAAGAERERSGELLITDVWVKQDKRWRVVARHVSQTSSAR